MSVSAFLAVLPFNLENLPPHPGCVHKCVCARVCTVYGEKYMHAHAAGCSYWVMMEKHRSHSILPLLFLPPSPPFPGAQNKWRGWGTAQCQAGVLSRGDRHQSAIDMMMQIRQVLRHRATGFNLRTGSFLARSQPGELLPGCTWEIAL